MRVPAIEKAVTVLQAIADADRPPGLADLVRETGLPRSSIHDLLSSMRATGLVEATRFSTFTLGLLLVELAGSRLAGSDLVTEFVHVCDHDARLAGRTVVLGILDGEDTVYVATRPGAATLAVNYHVGMRLPANCTATGKSILKTLPAARIETVFNDPDRLHTLTGSSIARLDLLRADLEKTADRGYVVDDEETAVGMICIGAPVYARGNTIAVGAVATSMVKAGLGETERTRVARGIVDLASDISRRLGGAPSPVPTPANLTRA